MDVDRRRALTWIFRGGAALAVAPLATACARAAGARQSSAPSSTGRAESGPASASTGATPPAAACTPVGVASLPGMSAAATSAFLQHNGLSNLQGYCFAGGGKDTVLVDPHWYPVMIGLVPGTAYASLIPLDAALRAANFDSQLLQAPFRDVYTNDGHRYAVALGWLPLAVWANGRLLRRLRLAPPPTRTTLKELLRYCGRVRLALTHAGLYPSKRSAGVQVLSQQDLEGIFTSLLAAFIEGYGGSVAALPAQPRDVPGIPEFAQLLAFAGGTKPWSAGSAVLTIASGLASRSPADHVSYFPQLQQPVLPVTVYGVGCNGSAKARLPGVGLLAAALAQPDVQRSLAVTARLNPTAQALSSFAGWVPKGIPPAPLTEVPRGWNVSWQSGVFDDPLWDAALSTVRPSVAASTSAQLIAGALEASIAGGVRASAARVG